MHSGHPLEIPELRVARHDAGRKAEGQHGVAQFLGTARCQDDVAEMIVPDTVHVSLVDGAIEMPDPADETVRLRRAMATWPDDGSTRAVLARTNRELMPAVFQ